MKISLTLNPDLAKSSVCSLISMTVLISVSKTTEKKKVTRKLLNMYQSIFFIEQVQKYQLSAQIQSGFYKVFCVILQTALSSKLVDHNWLFVL